MCAFSCLRRSGFRIHRPQTARRTKSSRSFSATGHCSSGRNLDRGVAFELPCCLPLRLSSPNPPARQRDGARFGATLRPAGAMAPLSRGVPALISSPALMSALLAFRYARAPVADAGFFPLIFATWTFRCRRRVFATSPTDLPTPRTPSRLPPRSHSRSFAQSAKVFTHWCVQRARESESGRGRDGGDPGSLSARIFTMRVLRAPVRPAPFSTSWR